MPAIHTARERFRHAGRQVLAEPTDPVRHEARLDAACALDGAEPLQGAMADMLHACHPDPARFVSIFLRPRFHDRLAAFVAKALRQQAESGVRLAQSSSLATRWSVIATPSLDVPQRARLCGVDDSREIAERATAAILASEESVEEAFLAHCEGSVDTLAFMLARRALMRQGRMLSPRWEAVSRELQAGTRL